MKIETPYYSQFVDIKNPFWMLRACGAICFKMVSETQGAQVGDVIVFCEVAKLAGGYDMQNGWVHDYIIKKAEEIGLSAYRKEGMTEIDELLAFLEKGRPVIASVEKRLLEQIRFHMIVLVGFEKDEFGALTDFYYHEPESTDKEKGKYRKCTREVFLEYWRGKAIFISREEK